MQQKIIPYVRLFVKLNRFGVKLIKKIGPSIDGPFPFWDYLLSLTDIDVFKFPISDN